MLFLQILSSRPHPSYPSRFFSLRLLFLLLLPSSTDDHVFPDAPPSYPSFRHAHQSFFVLRPSRPPPPPRQIAIACR